MKNSVFMVVVLLAFLVTSGIASAQTYKIQGDTLSFPIYQIPPKMVKHNYSVKKVSVDRLPHQRDYTPCFQQAVPVYCAPAPPTPVCIGLIGGICRIPLGVLDALFGGL